MSIDLDFLKQMTDDDFIRNQSEELKPLLEYIKREGFEYEYEERAGILENDGGWPRKDAEKKAAMEIIDRIDELPF